MPFGDVIVVGEERLLALSRPMDMLLVQQARANGTDIAYVIGSASAGGGTANHQGFLAGTMGTLLRVSTIVGSVASGDLSCRVRAVGRVRLDSLRTVRPYRIALAAHVGDGAPRPRRARKTR